MADLEQRQVGEPAATELELEDVYSVAAVRAKGLLQSLGIKTVICVDDVNATSSIGTAEAINEKLVASDALFAAVTLALEGQDGFEEVDELSHEAVADYLRETWDRLSPQLRQQVTGLARMLVQDHADNLAAVEIEDDLRAEVVLRGLFSEEFRYYPLSLSDWLARGRDLLDPENGSLVLFDLSFTAEREASDRLGEELLSDLLQEGRTDVWAGLLTYSAPDEDAERSLTQDLRTSHPAVASQIAVLGKFRTTDPNLLPVGLRALLLVNELSAYRVLVKHAIAEAALAADGSFSNLSDLTIVESFAAAQIEGAFELDQPVRLPLRAFANSVTRALRTDGFGGDHLPQLRGRAFEAFRSAGDDAPQLREVLRADRFDPEQHVNELGLPLEIGDLFKFETLFGDGREADYFILLGQACDLSMRPRGTRTPDLRVATLSRVLPLGEGPVPATKAQLGYLFEDSLDLFAVDLRAVNGLPVSLDVLDATVFNHDGRSLISLKYDENRAMARGWYLRLKALQRNARTALKEYQKLVAAVAPGVHSTEVGRAIAVALTSSSRNPKYGPTVEMNPAEESVRYGVQRIGRVRAEFAVALAGAANQYQSRPAYDADVVTVPR